jgi:prepilin-type N-terminal cleavage/methylation domain-containing protein
MSARTRRRLADESGFTLVELLVVIVIIGILASIGIAAFLNQRSKAQDGEAKVYAATAEKALEVWHSDHETYAGASVASLERIEPSLGNASNLTLAALGKGTFKVSVDSDANANGGGTFSVERLNGGGTRRDCTNPGHGSCLSAADGNGNRW